MLTLDFLQHYSWIVVSSSAAVYVFLLFVYSAGSMGFMLGADERQREIIFKAIDVKWRFPIIALFLFFIFAFIAFPGFQSAKVGYGYVAWMMFMIILILHAVSCEILRHNPSRKWLKNTCRFIITICGWIIPFIIGCNGSSFFTGTGTIELISINYGLVYLAAAQTSALLYLYCVINDEEIAKHIVHGLKINGPILILLLISTVCFLFSRNGLEYDADGHFYVVELKYLVNLLSMTHTLAICIAGISLILIGLTVALVHSIQRAFWCHAAGVLLCAETIFEIVALNNTALFPCYSDPQLSLSIANSSASYNTLLILGIASVILLPLALFLLYRIWNKTK